MGKSRESTIGIESPASRGVVVTDPKTGLPLGEKIAAKPPVTGLRPRNKIREAVPAKSETTTSVKRPKATTKPNARQKAGIEKAFLGKNKDS